LPSSEGSNSSLTSFQNGTINGQTLKTSKMTFVDPSVNAIIIQLKKELDEVKKKKEELQNELSATKFNPDRLVYVGSQINSYLNFIYLKYF